MIHLPRTLAALDTPAFAATLAGELAALGAAALGLERALARSSMLADDVIEVSQLGVRREGGRIVVRVGVFFAGVIAGCSCADDPTTIDRLPEYCELRLSIDPSDAATLIEFDPEISP